MFGFEPHPKQRLAMESEAEIVEMACAKKAGKTYSLIYKGIEEVLKPRGKKENFIAVISLTHPHCRLSFNKICLRLEQNKTPFLTDHRNQNPGYVRVRNLAGEEVHLSCYQVKDPEANLGALWDFALIDEFARFPASIWDDYLQMNISRAFIATSPYGRKHPAFEFFKNGLKKEYEGEFFSVNFDVFSNHKMEGFSADGNHTGMYAAMLRKAERTKKISPLVYRQDFLGEFLETGDTFFKNIDGNFSDSLQWREDGVIVPPREDRYYSIGVDLARYRDHTVISVLDEYRTLCYWKKLGHIDWNTQKYLISQSIRRYKGKTLADATGQGQPVVEDLIQTFGEDVEAFVFTRKSKDEILSNLLVDISEGRMQLPEIPDLRDALESVYVEQKDSGRLEVGDDETGHCPDEVASLALAAWGLKGFPTRYELAEEGFRRIKQPAGGWDACGRPIHTEEKKPEQPFRNRIAEFLR